jgi:hypothetical protein
MEGIMARWGLAVALVTLSAAGTQPAPAEARRTQAAGYYILNLGPVPNGISGYS